MTLKHPEATTRPAPEKLAVTPRFGLADRTIPRHEIPVDELDPETAYQVIHDELMLDGNARMNAATFVTTWMEPQATRLMNGTPAPITFADVAAALTEATGHPVRSVDLTEEQARPRFEGNGLPDRLAAHLAGVFGVIRAGGFERATGDVRAITGRPARGIAGFAHDFAAAFTPATAPSGQRG
ncbi:hypothetical protein [Actinoplanes utahensis]|uniref:NmrA family transcriptional regulator n=1 Tax=Actinoplanes utahensis TaxID=1869 RepID=A0A0A6USJ8_ACTUT|nr:hypothetical protein MB27_07495 [Actinoplanes utahensis]GIF29933.1 hypothetical protein Aut01nite_29190 [Actinoplanes utahensis]